MTSIKEFLRSSLGEDTSISSIRKNHDNVIDRIVAAKALAAYETANIFNPETIRNTMHNKLFGLIVASMQDDPSSLSQIIESLHHNETNIRLAAIDGIASIFNPYSLRFIESTKSQLPDPQIIEHVIDLLKEQLDSTIMCSVMECASISFNEKTSKYYYDRSSLFLETLNNQDNTVRIYSLDLLSKMKCLAAVESIIVILEEDDTDIKWLALNALQKITGKEFVFGNNNPMRWRKWWAKNKNRLLD